MKTRIETSQERYDRKTKEAWDEHNKLFPTKAQPATAKHSPLPWSEEGGIITAGISPGQPYIADCRFGPAGHRNANARLIIRAVNNADKLAEALRMVSNGGWLVEYPQKTQYAVRQALAAYEGSAQQ